MTVYHIDGTPGSFAPGVMPVTYYGCPWHGVMKDGELYAFDGTHKKSLPDWYQTTSAARNGGEWCATQLVRVPGQPPISRTPEQQTWDAAQNFDWKNYALVGGKALHGISLGDENWIIYIDGNGNPWLLDLSLYADATEFRCEVWLRKIFGRFNMTSYPTINSQLADYTDPDIESVSGDYQYSGPVSMERNSTGSEIFVNIYSDRNLQTSTESGESGYGQILLGYDPYDTDKPKWRQLIAVYKVSITGNGSVLPATLGDGITASVVVHKTFADCYSEELDVLMATNTVKTSGYPTDIWTTTTKTYHDTRGDCPYHAIDEYEVTPDVYSSDVYEREDRYHRLIRCLFDDADTQVEFSATYRERSEERLSYTHDVTGSYSYEKHEVNDCSTTEYYEESTGGTITRVYINERFDVSNVFDLKRNGIVVATFGQYEYQYDERTDTKTYDGYVAGTPTSISGLYADHGRTVELPSGYFTEVVLHQYSPQMYGVQVRSQSVDPPEESVLGPVLVPWGVDETHVGTQLTHGGYKCVGTVEPVKHQAYWYEPGVSDETGARINFV